MFGSGGKELYQSGGFVKQSPDGFDHPLTSGKRDFFLWFLFHSWQNDAFIIMFGNERFVYPKFYEGAGGFLSVSTFAMHSLCAAFPSEVISQSSSLHGSPQMAHRVPSRTGTVMASLSPCGRRMDSSQKTHAGTTTKF
jgi:hypothetical protein